MNNDMNVNSLIRRMKETRLPEVDVTTKVMQRVYCFHGKHRLHRKQRWAFRKSPVWIAMSILLFIATASVSAAILYKTTWNGVQVYIGGNTKDTIKTANTNEPSYKEKLETVLSKSADIWKTISLDEAEKEFPFTLLRPQASKFSLVKSLGVVPQDKNYHVKSADEWWLGGFYDIFQWNQHDIMVRQNMDVEMTESVQNPKKTMSMTFQDSPWESVEVDDDTLAIFMANGTEKLLIVKYKTADSKVISIELEGDIAKEDLVKLAKAYVGK
ncbi:hypothetical protein [Paenibacillus periandrae]|uniref:hypothetical protein n=1 Tax=Paenibacillus periandrae TaxID=1761741 RepID=UPI001F090C71|nr:hypothetical protein [Paenibacillus periandrae]